MRRIGGPPNGRHSDLLPDNRLKLTLRGRPTPDHGEPAPPAAAFPPPTLSSPPMRTLLRRRRVV